MTREYYKRYDHATEKEPLRPLAQTTPQAAATATVSGKQKPSFSIMDVLNFKNEELLLGLVLFFLLMEEDKDLLLIAIVALLFMHK